MNQLEILNILKNDFNLDFTLESNEQLNLSIDDQEFSITVQQHRTASITKENIEQLNLLRSNNAPFFKWHTSNSSVFGFGNLLDELKCDTNESNIVSSLNKHSVIPLFHSIDFPQDINLKEKKIYYNPWESWNFPQLVIPTVYLEYYKNSPQELKLKTFKNSSSPINNDSQKSLALELISPDVLQFKNEEHKESIIKQEQWSAQVNHLLSDFKQPNARTTKVVLARIKSLTGHKRYDPLNLFHSLTNLHDRTKLTHFYLESEGKSFSGFSPENLLKRINNEISIDAIAGTRARPKSPEEDDKLEQELVSSTKEQSEHLKVIEAIEKCTHHLGKLHKAKQEVLKLSSVQHLKTALTLQLEQQDRYAIYQLAKILHPTPAVGGTPREESLRSIELLEDFRRGLYAGAIGLQTETTDQFIVAIRSLLTIDNLRVNLFAGAGIVADSHALSEWKELNTKFDSFFPTDLYSNRGVNS